VAGSALAAAAADADAGIQAGY